MRTTRHRALLGALFLLASASSSLVSAAEPTEPLLRVEEAWEGRVRARLAPRDDADLMVLFGSEQRGRLGTCACPSYPLGSVERIETYRRAAASFHRDTPLLLVNAGYWLDDTISADGQLRADVVVGNTWMLRALEAAQWDALNITPLDLPWLATQPRFPAAAVSANIQPLDPETPGPAPFLLFERGGLRVAITGVSQHVRTFIEPETFAVSDPVEALSALLPELRAAADLVIVLAYQPEGQIHALMALDGVDLVIDAGGYQERYPPLVEGGAVWVRTDRQTRRLGEARVWMADGRIVALVDRAIDMDAAIRSDRSLRKLAEEADLDVRAAQIRMSGG